MNINKKKIIFFANVDWFFISHRINLAKQMQKSGYQIFILCAVTGKQDFLKSHGFNVIKLDLHRRGMNPINILSCFLKTIFILRSIKPDIMHAITTKPNLIGGIAALFCRIPLVVFAISGFGVALENTGNLLADLLRKFCVKRLYQLLRFLPKKVFIVQNVDDHRRLKRIVKLKNNEITLIPGSGVEIKPFKKLKLPQHAPKILFASRLLKTKGLIEFVKMAGEVKKQLSETDFSPEFVCAGNSDFANPASVTIEEINFWRRNGDVKWVGHIENIVPLINKSLIVVLPSYYGEGLPKILAEAAACGRAVVTTDHPGCRDAIINNITGILVHPKSVDDLTNKVKFLILNQEQCSMMGMAGRKLAQKKFSIDAITSAHMRIYSAS
tara:strand:+ start:1353 stop:2501 length:1149 start_codon:yes stop_codon:yes gene_type:complete